MVIPTSDFAKLFEKSPGRDRMSRCIAASPTSVHLGDPSSAGTVDCMVLKHVGAVAAGDEVLVVLASSGANYIIGKF